MKCCVEEEGTEQEHQAERTYDGTIMPMLMCGYETWSLS